MNAAYDSAKILDFTAYRERRLNDTATVACEQEVVPMVMWYPVWVFVPQPFRPY